MNTVEKKFFALLSTDPSLKGLKVDATYATTILLSSLVQKYKPVVESWIKEEVAKASALVEKDFEGYDKLEDEKDQALYKIRSEYRDIIPGLQSTIFNFILSN